MSCASETFCVAGNVSGEVAIYNGRSWSPARKVSPQGTMSLSCPSPSFCMSMGNGYFATYNGKTWSRPRTFAFNVVSCASASFCVAVGGGRAVAFGGTAWSTRQSDHLLDVQFGSPAPPYCSAWRSVPARPPSTTASLGQGSGSPRCLPGFLRVQIVLRNGLPMGEAETYNGTTWSAPSDLDPRLSQHVTLGRSPAGRLVPVVEVLHRRGRLRLYHRTIDTLMEHTFNGIGQQRRSCPPRPGGGPRGTGMGRDAGGQLEGRVLDVASGGKAYAQGGGGAR